MTLYYSLVSTVPTAPELHITLSSALFPSAPSSSTPLLSLPAIRKHAQPHLRSGSAAQCYAQGVSTDKQCLGLRTSRVRDGCLHVAHHPIALQGQAWSLHLHIREPADSQVTIWVKGGSNSWKRRGIRADHQQITFIFILILFIDSVNRVYRVQVELSQAKYQGGAAG